MKTMPNGRVVMGGYGDGVERNVSTPFAFPTIVLTETEDRQKEGQQWGKGEKGESTLAATEAQEGHSTASKKAVAGKFKDEKTSKKTIEDSNTTVSKSRRAPTPYNLFMKDEVARVKILNPSLDRREVFKQAAAKWTDIKEQRTAKQATKTPVGKMEEDPEKNEGSGAQGVEAEGDSDKELNCEDGPDEVLDSEGEAWHSSQEEFEDEFDEEAYDSCDEGGDDLREQTKLVFAIPHIASNLLQVEMGDSAIYMSAVLEYLAAEIIQVSGKACKATVQHVENSDSDDVEEIFVILPKHIKHVVGQDEELSALFSDTKIMMWGGGNDSWAKPKIVCPMAQKLYMGISKVAVQVTLTSFCCCVAATVWYQS